MRSEFLGDDKDHFVLILKRFQLFLPFIFRILVLFHILIPTSHRPFQSILDGPVSARVSSFFGTMRHILSLRNSCLLAKHAIALGTVMLIRISVGSFV